jgi:hypothetical protein
MLSEGNKSFGELGKKLYDFLLDVQLGVIKDHPWTTVIDV